MPGFGSEPLLQDAAHAFHEAADMQLVIAADMRCKIANPAFLSFTGHTLTALTERPVSWFIYEGDCLEFAEALAQIQSGQCVSLLGLRVRTAGSEDRSTDWNIRLSGDTYYCGLRDASGRLWRDALRTAEQNIVTAVLNNTNLHQILTLACGYFEALVPDGLCSVLLLDPTRRRLRTGAAPSLPSTYTDALHDLVIGPDVGSCGTAIYTRKTVITKDIRRDPRWNQFHELAATHGLAACWSIPLFDGNREPLGSFAIYHRVPHYPAEQEIEVAKVFSNAVAVAIERRNEHSLLIEARLSAETASTAKSEFLTHMSHELRTPLNAIIGFSDAMLSGVFGPLGSNRYGEYARDIHVSGKLLLDIIDGILDVARIEAGKFTLKEEVFQIAPLIYECVRWVKRPDGAAAPRITVHISQPTVHLTADRQAIVRVVLNLLSNALKFTLADGVIEVGVEIDNEDLMLSISDTGIGISEEDLANIGKPFVRAETKHQRYIEGTGLGLFITRSLIELHGGRLEIKSQSGVGTEVRAFFPADRVTHSK